MLKEEARNRNSALIRHTLFVHYTRTVTSVQRKPVKIMKIGKKTPLLWATAAVVIALGLSLSSLTLLHGGPKQEILVQTQRQASETALLTGRSASSGQLTSGDVVHINTATLEELEGLKGIGAVRAQAILDYRRENGAFLSPEELLRVDGIGPATLEDILPYITVE